MKIVSVVLAAAILVAGWAHPRPICPYKMRCPWPPAPIVINV